MSLSNYPSSPDTQTNTFANPSNSLNKTPSSNNSGLTHLQLAIEGMSCQACASRIEKVLNKKPAIEQASVNFASERLNVDFDASQASDDDIIAWVAKTGFAAKPIDSGKSSQADSMSGLSAWPWRLIALWVCLLPFLVGMAGMLVGQAMAWMPPVWIQFLLATIVQFGLAWPFYKSAWSSIKGGLANMDVLVVIGTLTIWAYSTYTWLVLGHGIEAINAVMQGDFSLLAQTSAHLSHDAGIYFEAGVMIIAFVRLGKYLEDRTKKHSLNSIDLLLSLTPNSVEQQQADGSFVSVSMDDVKVGDHLRAKQGSRIATDGIVVEGSGWSDESHLTGESVPLQKQAGSKVLAGALVDNGSLIYQVTALGSATQLGDMVQALSEAQGSKANLARLADRVTAIFVPLVIGIALITLGLTWWLTADIERAILHAVSVLVIACPCALGLATPAAIMAGMGVAARHGVWFKDATSLEAAGNIDTVVVDKTGTLTIGRPVLVDQLVVDKSIKIEEVLQLAASVEVHASHPLATALVKVAHDKQLELLDVTDVNVVQGQGISATLPGLGVIKVGSPKFASLTLPKFMPKVWNIASTVAVSVNDIPLGAFALADDLKADAAQTIDALKADGIRVVLMSGDNASVVEHVAEQLNIDSAYASLSPRDKADKISALQVAGHRVAMVGDGVNDAPAMATADASFAMHEGTDVAQHSASARLMGSSLMHVDAAQKIATATVINIKQNLFFAFIYNCIGIPLAAFGFLNPMIAAAAMAMSSISVLMNAMRLTRFQTSVGESPSIADYSEKPLENDGGDTKLSASN